MAVIISKNGKNAQKIERTRIEEEAYLQRYIHENPDSLPLHEVKEDLKLLILGKEFPTDSGPIDAIGVDSDGDIYIIETKLYKNPDKRLVIAQMLDYGAALWNGYKDFSTFTEKLESMPDGKLKGSLSATLVEFFGLEEGAEDVIENIRQNLLNGRFQFVVLMDHLHSRLKNLISFINANSNFRVLGCELEFYHYDQFEILIPNLYGAEARSSNSASGSSSSRKKWTREMYSKELNALQPLERRDRIRNLIALAETNSDLLLSPTVGTGKLGSLSYYDTEHIRIVTFYLSGIFEVVIDPFKPNFPAIKELLKKFDGKLIWKNRLVNNKVNYYYLASPIEALPAEAFDQLKQFLTEFARIRTQKVE